MNHNHDHRNTTADRDHDFRARALLAAFERKRLSFSETASLRATRMAQGYATGRYPTPADKQHWLRDLVVGLERDGYITRDHEGRILITLDFRGEGRIPGCEVGGYLGLN